MCGFTFTFFLSAFQLTPTVPGKACARNSRTAASGRYRNPPASTSNLLITGDEGPCFSTSVVDSPMSGARCYVHERGNIRVISGLRNDSPSITMADEHYRTLLTLNCACHLNSAITSRQLVPSDWT